MPVPGRAPRLQAVTSTSRTGGIWRARGLDGSYSARSRSGRDQSGRDQSGRAGERAQARVDGAETVGSACGTRRFLLTRCVRRYAISPAPIASASMRSGSAPSSTRRRTFVVQTTTTNATATDSPAKTYAAEGA